MKFWQLDSIFRADKSALQKLLSVPEWAVYLKWFNEIAQHVESQNRSILDAVIPEQLIVSAMTRCDYRFRVENGFLRRTPNQCEDAMSATDVHGRHGAAAIEELLEKGSFPVPNGLHAIEITAQE